MQIVFYVITTDNKFSKDRCSENMAMILADSAAKQIDYKTTINNLNYYDEHAVNEFKKAINNHENDVFYILIPGGQCAQEFMERALKDSSSQNTIVVYNSNWSFFGGSSLQFGNIAELFCYNIGASNVVPSEVRALEPEMEALAVLTMFLREARYQKYKNHGCLSPSPVHEEENFREKRSKKDGELWTKATEELPQRIEQIINFCQNQKLLHEYSIKYQLMKSFCLNAESTDLDLLLNISLKLFEVSEINSDFLGQRLFKQ